MPTRAAVVYVDVTSANWFAGRNHNSAMRRGELVGLILAAISTVTNCQIDPSDEEYSDDESSEISKGALIGIFIGCVAFVVGGSCWGFWFRRRQKCRRDCASRDECQTAHTAFPERPVESGVTQPQQPHRYTAPREWYYEDSTEARHGLVTLEGLRSVGLPDDT